MHKNSAYFRQIIFVLLSITLACAFLPELPVSSNPTATTGKTSTPFTPIDTPTILPPTPVPGPVRFAVIGDYGDGGEAEGMVAELVKSWDPDLIITTGDNNYPHGQKSMIDSHIGQFYADFIYPYHGEYKSDAEINRFFPSLGNHDVWTKKGEAYLDYFTLPGNERYYTFNWDFVQFFALNSNAMEPDGFRKDSAQALWLENEIKSSETQWQIVYFHQPPYSSGIHGSTEYMRWPFKNWGVDLVISGHDHTYERFEIDGLTYIVNGLGGHSIYDFVDILPESQVRYNSSYGALLVEAFPERITFQFVNTSNKVIDQFEITAD